MKTLSSNFAVGLLLAGTFFSRAAILDIKRIDIDFTNPAVLTNQATWSEPDKLTINRDGLGWDGEPASLRDGWIQTKPLAIGQSWRTPFAITVRATIQPAPHAITLNNGRETTPYGGDVYVRYSPDLHHWSSWQVLQQPGIETTNEKPPSGRHFSATIRVPYRERARYGELLSDYSSLDVPWRSDEEAAVRWILKREPDFFDRQIPFMGCVEFLYEGGFHGGQRVQSFNAEVSYAMSGLHSAPKDPAVYKERENMPWRFVAATESRANWAEQCLAVFENIKPGMTRRELETRLVMDGGLQSVSPVRYAHPDFPFLKLDVEYDFKKNAADQNRAILGEDDKVTRVSRPYLERPFRD